MPFRERKPVKKSRRRVTPLSFEVQGLPGRLKQARARANLGSVELDKQAEVSQGTTSRLESGDRLADVETIFRLSKALSISVHWLVTGEGRMHAEYSSKLARASI